MPDPSTTVCRQLGVKLDPLRPSSQPLYDGKAGTIYPPDVDSKVSECVSLMRQLL